MADLVPARLLLVDGCFPQGYEWQVGALAIVLGHTVSIWINLLGVSTSGALIGLA